jgi:hypothetical protein
MPIYQRPNRDIGVAQTISGTTTPFTVVALKNPASGQIVANTDTDSSGEYSFTVDNSIPLTVIVSDQNNFENFTETSVGSPAYPYSWYGVKTTGLYACIWVNNFPQSNGSSTTWCIGVPSASVVDAGPYQFGDARDTYGFTGPGEGAEISVSLCPIGGYYPSYSSRIQLEEQYGGQANPLHRFDIKSFGRNYQSPYLKLTGTVLQSSGQSVEWLLDNGYSTAYQYNGANFYTENRTWYHQISGTQLDILLANGIESYWGSDRSTWGTYQSDYSGGKFSAGVPDETNITVSEDSTVSSEIPLFLNGITDPAIVKKHGMQVYYTLIYGPGGSPGNFTSPSFSYAAQQGLISKQELDIMKGYLGRHFYVAELSGAVGVVPAQLADIGNFFYQMAQAAAITVNNAGNGNIQWTSTHPDALANNAFVGYLQYYSLTFVDLMQNIANEYQSFNRQSKGTAIPTAQYTQKIYPLFQKAGITSFSTTDGSTSRQYAVSQSNITYN